MSELYTKSTVKPYVHEGVAGWLYERTPTDRTFYKLKYEAVADAKKDLRRDSIDFLAVYTKRGFADYSGWSLRGQKLLRYQKRVDDLEWSKNFWLKKCEEKTTEKVRAEAAYKNLQSRHTQMVNLLKELLS